MSLGDIGISTINGGAIGVKNAIINGNFAVNQRGVSGTVTLAAGAYGHDRFKAGASGCTYTFATANNITTLTISAGSLIQVIEGNNLFTGTYTLSWVGTAQGKIGGGSYASSGMTGTPAGGSNLNIEFNTGTLSLVQFEPGAIRTPFERRPFGDELVLCQRYAYQMNANDSNGANRFALGFAQSSTKAFCQTPHPVPLRAKPTVVTSALSTLALSDSLAGTVPTTISVQTVTSDVNKTCFEITTASGLTAFRPYFLEASSSGATLLLSAEL